MAHLLDLPEELILIVTRHLGLENLNLALTCKRLAGPARVGLLREVPIGAGGEAHQQQSRTLQAFEKYLDKYQYLVHAIEQLDLKWGESGPLDEAYHGILMKVACSTSLRRLGVKLSVGRQISQLHVLQEIPTVTFSKLRTMEIHMESGALIASYLASLCELFQLKSLTCTGCTVMPSSKYWAKDHLSEHSIVTATLPLQYLCAIGDMIHLDLLKLLAPRTRNLLTLKISIPSSGVWTNSDTVSGYRGRFSPATVEKCIGYASESLDKLSIHSMRMSQGSNNPVRIKVQDHDDTVLNLSGFTRLSRVRVVSCLMLGASTSAVTASIYIQNNMADNLPQNVEHLTIDFISDQGVFENLEELLHRGHFIDWDEYARKHFIEPDKLAWLYNVIDAKNNGLLPRLRSIHVEENWPSK